MELFDYQKEAVDRLETRLRESPRVLLQAPTGAGKAVLAAEIMRRYAIRYPKMRIGFAVHRKELVEQAADKLIKVWPEGVFHVGMACASAGRVETGKRVTVGSIQTLRRRDFPRPFDLLIADEAHHIPCAEDGGEWHSMIGEWEAARPGLRVLGFTATPYRLADGPIYGPPSRPGRTNFFPALDWSITIDELVALGRLAPWRGKVPVDMGGELSGVRRIAGEYSERDLEGLMCRERHVSTAVEAYSRYGEGRKKCVLFGVTVAHAEILAEAFRGAGHRAAAVHSRLGREDRESALRDFAEGRLEFIANVGVLTEGWDCPPVDLIMLCRPTMSPGLYVQMLGRGLRAWPGKKDLLFLDLADNWKRHGDPSSPRFPWLGGDGSGEGEAPFKVCGNPDCKSAVPLGSAKCPACGWEFPVKKPEEARKVPELKEVAPGQAPRGGNGNGVGEGKRPYGLFLEPYVTRRGDRMARLTVYFEGARPVPTYLDVEGQASVMGWKRARQVWLRLAPGAAAPKSVDDAVARAGELVLPESLTVSKDPNGFRVIREWR
ncbi:MAG: DEAD/DEAH box helicase [Deltaproteobacteria bacterium]|nr:DEAD/DEAH box helicase [Deltaproteobacteria bacterium]